MNSQNDNIRILINKCLDLLSITSEYSYDYNLDETDYSVEMAFSELLYNTSILKRTSKKSKEMDYIFDSTNDLMELMPIDFGSRLELFHKKYFNAESVNSDLITLKTSLKSKQTEETRSTMEDAILDILEIRDRSFLYANHNSYFFNVISKFYNYSEKLYTALYTSIDETAKKYNNIFNNFAEEIETFREYNFIPNTKEYTWWYVFQPITIMGIKTAMKNSINESLLFNEIDIKFKNTPFWDSIKDNFIDYLDRIKTLDTRVKDIIDETAGEIYSYFYKGEKTIEPALVYSQAPKNAIIPFDVLKNFIAQGEIIKDLISAIENTDSIDENERKYLLATAYLLIDEEVNAQKVLDHEL